MDIIKITNKNFSNVVADNDLVVIDFWAKWCEPCKSFKKVIKALSEKYPEVVFGAIDIEQEAELAKDFNIISVPSILVLRHQVLVYAESGALPATSVVELIQQAAKLTKEQVQKAAASSDHE